MKKEYCVPMPFVEKVKLDIFRINKKAKKLGLSPVLVEYGHTSYQKYQDTHGNTYNMPCVDITIDTGETPHLAGWSIIGKIEMDSAKIVKQYGDDIIPPEYFEDGGACGCDHCGVKRHRNYVFVLKNDEGEHKRVGGNCLEDFMRMDIGLFLFKAKLKNDVEDIFEDGFTEYVKDDAVNLERYMCAVMEAIQRHGYVKSGATNPTRDMAHYLMLKGDYPQHIDEARKMIEWAKTLEHNNEPYNFNLWSLTQEEYVFAKYLGYIASLPVAYKQAHPIAANEWFGNPGEKFDTEVRYGESKSHLTVYGAHYFHNFYTRDNRCITWGTGKHIKDIIDDVNNGRYYRMTGTIKQHSEFRGFKSTNVLRCKVEPVNKPTIAPTL